MTIQTPESLYFTFYIGLRKTYFPFRIYEMKRENIIGLILNKITKFLEKL